MSRLVRALGEVTDLRDPSTGKYPGTEKHSEGVARVAVLIGKGMGLSPTQTSAIRYAAYLHDIGKIGVPDRILLKPGRLTPKEFACIKEHPGKSADILESFIQSYFFPREYNLLLGDMISVVRHHHERWDGEGYPSGIKKDMIPLGACILAVADTYEAITSYRPYKKARSKDDALEEIAQGASTQFNPHIVWVFLDVMGAGHNLECYFKGEEIGAL